MDRAIFLFFYFFSLFMLAMFGLHKYFLLHLYRRYKNLPPPSPKIPKEWPLVCVQLPVYNERYVVKRLLRSIVQLDYPQSKLHIQVLDDSTDETTKLLQGLILNLQRKGYQIEHIRRGSREGYKAGALAYGLPKTSADWIAIFDADFFPNPDFLKKTVPSLLQEGIGMVQTRWGHANRNYSLLTRLQGIFLDAHFNIEHLARHRSGRFFNFNGTAGIWRKKAIEDAGGWQHDTLTEDLDLSYRAQLAGWKFIYLPDVVAPAELPAEMNAYKSQQHRWAKGSVQTALKLYSRILKSDFPLFIRIEAIIHLSNNLAYLLMVIPAILLIPILKFQLELNWNWLVIVYFLTFLTSTLSVIIYYANSVKSVIGKLWPDVLYLPFLMAIGIGLSLNNSRAALEALFGHQSEFKRTPKFMIEGREGTWKRKSYKPKKGYQHIFEFLAAIYFILGLIYYLSNGFYVSLPFFLLFQFGFFYMALLSFKGQKT
jgi:cellulose synthase/poly-beta-1,6-N-acetylglucosamine synthase-like glycosyltransferase